MFRLSSWTICYGKRGRIHVSRDGWYGRPTNGNTRRCHDDDSVYPGPQVTASDVPSLSALDYTGAADTKAEDSGQVMVDTSAADGPALCHSNDLKDHRVHTPSNSESTGADTQRRLSARFLPVVRHSPLDFSGNGGGTVTSRYDD